MSREWKDVLDELRQDPEADDKLALRKIAAAEEELASVGRDFSSLNDEEAAGLLERMDISPDQFERIVSTYGEEEQEEAKADETTEEKEEEVKTEEKEEEVKTEEAAEEVKTEEKEEEATTEEAEVEAVTDEERQAFIDKWNDKSKDEWDAFVDSLDTQEQVDKVYQLLDLDAEKTAELVAVEEAAYHGVMRAYDELNKEAEAEAEPSTFEQIMAAADAATQKVEEEAE